MTEVMEKAVKVRVACSNIWFGGAKFFAEDVLTVSEEDVAPALERGQVKKTRDPENARVGADGFREYFGE